MFTLRIGEKTISAAPHTTVLEALRSAGFHPDAPCGGHGSCRKCTVYLDGVPCLACRTEITRDAVLTLPDPSAQLLSGSFRPDVLPDGDHRYVLAFDVGTTTVAGFLLDGVTGQLLSQAAELNRQQSFGADVISRIVYARENGEAPLRSAVWDTLRSLTHRLCGAAGVDASWVTLASFAANPAMHHLLLGLDTEPLVKPPYMPGVLQALVEENRGRLPVAENAVFRVLPNIAGFVGGDTAACLLSASFDRLQKLTLLMDIGTNGELVLGDGTRRIACSTAAGPALEGANIFCGMRGTAGAIDHVRLVHGALQCSVIGGGKAVGLCGSGLLDAIAVCLELGIIDPSGRMAEASVPADRKTAADGCLALRLQDDVVLTQKDVRQVQLAKAAIRAGIGLLLQQLDAKPEDISAVLLAGAFGNYLTPASACAIGLLPPLLLERIVPVGNAAGVGAGMAALSESSFRLASRLAETTEFLELGGLPDFQELYVDCMAFSEEEL